MDYDKSYESKDMEHFMQLKAPAVVFRLNAEDRMDEDYFCSYSNKTHFFIY